MAYAKACSKDAHLLQVFSFQITFPLTCTITFRDAFLRKLLSYSEQHQFHQMQFTKALHRLTWQGPPLPMAEPSSCFIHHTH